MRIALQRVTRGRVTVGPDTVGSIGPGLVALVGIAEGDRHEDAVRLAAKTVRLRVFPEGDRPFHRNVADLGGEVLVVSQFTLMADVRRGNRPSWSAAADPGEAEPLVEAYARAIEGAGVHVERGRFGAHMSVALENDGPVTVLLDSDAIGPGGG
ncbi:MAG: D-aminoacyl-tRNA deacylase [Miltoncostaeaceae bacterium]